MVGLECCLQVVQKNGFFWECEDKKVLREIFRSIGLERVKIAALSHVLAVTELIEGKASPRGLRMLKKIFLPGGDFDCSSEQERGIREKMWAYRQWLVDFFEIPYPQRTNIPVFFVDDAFLYKSRKFFGSAEDLENALKEINPQYSFAGLIARSYE